MHVLLLASPQIVPLPSKPQLVQQRHLEQAVGGGLALWRTLTTLLAVAVSVLLGGLPLVLMLRGSHIGRPPTEPGALLSTLPPSVSAVTYLLLVALPFVAGLITLMLGVGYLHQRRVMSLFVGLAGRWRWSRCGWGFMWWMIPWLVLTAVQMIIWPDDYQRLSDRDNFPAVAAGSWPGTWAGRAPVVVLVSLCFVVAQVLFEEALTRGYILQQSYAPRRQVWVAIIISALVFALLHWGNTEQGSFSISTMLVYYGLVGLLLATVTVWDDGLEMAVGIHLAANVGGLMLVHSSAGLLPTPAVFAQLGVSATRTFLNLGVGSLVVLTLLWRQRRKRLQRRHPAEAAVPLPVAGT